MNPNSFVGNLLIRAGVCDAAALARAAQVQTAQPVSVGRALASIGAADEDRVADALATTLRLERLRGAPPEVAEPVKALLQADFCRKRQVAPLGYEQKRLRLAVVDPLDDTAVRDVEFRTGRQVIAVVVTETWLGGLLDALYAPPPQQAVSYDMLNAVDPAGQVEATEDNEFELVDPATLAKDVQLPPIIRLVNLLLSDAAKAGASDVHIEPHENSLQVRQRIDGLLHNALVIPQHLKDATLSRLKIMSGMDIADRRKPQDGRSRLRFEGRRIDMRVSTLPTQFGEKVVIRFLNSDKTVAPIDQIDLSPHNLQALKSFLARPQGMILLTGPTGSGKTSTLYSALTSIKSPTNNIVTLEDPIEIQISGVNQMQINAKAGVTFASGLRSILRQDPNIILVGEIRDQETADIALGAAQTGHLLLSTLHTNDAAATITRLVDLGVQPFLIASSLIGIVAQRLVRRVCPACAVPQQPSAEAIEKAGGAAKLPKNAKWVAGPGCDQCGQSGMKGRLALHEVFTVTDDIREMISSRAAEQVIKQAARRAGMRTLLEDGIDKAAQGLTTLDEVVRVVGRDESSPSISDQPGAASAEAGARPDATATAGGRVLVVEDSPTIVTVVKYFLELEGFEVLVAENGLIGFEIALRERPDVIVTDVNMPGMGGMAMVRALRAEAQMADVRIAMLTSEDSVDLETEALAAGADDYILKPVEPRRLAARVKALRLRSVRAAS